jgi:hypothetical protein
VVPARAVDFPRPNPVANPTFDAPMPHRAPVLADRTITPLWYTATQGTVDFADADHDGDREAVISAAPLPGDGPTIPIRDLWQVATPTEQAGTLDFAALTFRLEHGGVPAGAAIRVGFALTPLFQLHPYAGVFNEGSLVFPAGAVAPGPDGRVVLDPLAAPVECPPDPQGMTWPPCEDFKAALVAAPDDTSRRAVLARARIVEVDFDGFSELAAGEQVVIDDVVITNDRSVAEVLAGNIPA